MPTRDNVELEDMFQSGSDTSAANLVTHNNPLRFLRYASKIRTNFVDGFDESCYESWAVTWQFLGFRSYLLNHPEAVRTVLIEQCENFPEITPGHNRTWHGSRQWARDE